MPKKAERPEKVKVGYRTYDVKVMDQITSTDYYGRHSAMHGVIAIQGDPDNEVAANTMLHEVIHAINAIWHEGEENEIPESEVAAMANGLQTVWCDNPDLFAWLHQEITKQR